MSPASTWALLGLAVGAGAAVWQLGQDLVDGCTDWLERAYRPEPEVQVKVVPDTPGVPCDCSGCTATRKALAERAQEIADRTGNTVRVSFARDFEPRRITEAVEEFRRELDRDEAALCEIPRGEQP